MQGRARSHRGTFSVDNVTGRPIVAINRKSKVRKGTIVKARVNGMNLSPKADALRRENLGKAVRRAFAQKAKEQPTRAPDPKVQVFSLVDAWYARLVREAGQERFQKDFPKLSDAQLSMILRAHHTAWGRRRAIRWPNMKASAK